MESLKIVFWNVDTQVDFVEPNGKLYVPGAFQLKPIWDRLTKLAKERNIQVVNTADYHYASSKEIDKDPDMVNTFPEHCMAGTKGAEYILETTPENPTVFNWDEDCLISPEITDVKAHRNILIRKDAFDVFSGNPYTDKVVGALRAKVVYVYGVTTNVCVDYAVVNLAKRVDNVFVIEDGIKELPNIPLPFDQWRKLGVKLISSDELIKKLS